MLMHMQSQTDVLMSPCTADTMDNPAVCLLLINTLYMQVNTYIHHTDRTADRQL